MALEQMTGGPHGAHGIGWQAAALAVAVLVLMPVLALAIFAAKGSPGLWTHLIRATSCPRRPARRWSSGRGGRHRRLHRHGHGMAGRRLRFSGRRFWLGAAALAVPTYISSPMPIWTFCIRSARCRRLIRDILGIAARATTRNCPISARCRAASCCWGWCFIPMSICRCGRCFVMQAGNLMDAARMLGAGPVATFWRVVLLARPAVAVGTALALMESLNDIGAAEFLGVRTMTVSVYSTWINRSDLPGRRRSRW